MIDKLIAGACAALLLASAAQAQTFGSTATALSSGVSLTNASSTTPVAFETSTGNGQKVANLMCSYRTGSTVIGSTITVELSILQGGVTYPMGQSILPASTGAITTAGQVNLLQTAGTTTNLPFAGMQTDSDGNTYLPIEPSAALQIRVTGAISVGNTLTCLALGQKY